MQAPPNIYEKSAEKMKWDALCHKLDTIASANGCKVIDYELASHAHKRGFIREYSDALWYVALGMAIMIGIMVLRLGPIVVFS